MPATFTVSSGSERVVNVYPKRHRSSRSTASVQSPTTSSGSRSYSSASSDSWSRVDSPYDEDGIAPSDSASRPRQRVSRRHATEAQPAPTRRHSSRRGVVDYDEEPRRRHTTSHSRHTHSRPRRSESRRTPSDDSASLASYDDYPYGHHGAPQPPPQRGYPQPSGYRHVPAPQSHGGYPPSMASTAPYHDPYAAQQALVHMPPPQHQPDPFAYGQPNPFAPHHRENPFSPISPMSSAGDSGYFATDAHAPSVAHHPHRPSGPPRPQSYIAPSSHYGSEIMPSYGGHAPYPGYGMPGMPPPGYGMPWAYGPRGSPPAREEKESKPDKSELESLKALIQKHEEARIAAEKERLAKAEADAAAAAAKRAEEEAEKRKKEEIASASKKAKEEAEKKAAEDAKKAKEEHEKKMAEAKKAQEELEKKHKELEAEAAKNKPPPDSLMAPIKFKDAVGRTFSFPWHLCKTWKGMESLIKQAFAHVDTIGDHVHQGHYDLTGPDGEIILPQVWDTMIKPDWEVNMHMWPMPEPEKEDKLAKDAMALADPFAMLNMGDFGLLPNGKKKKKEKDSSKKKSKSPEIVTVVPSGASGMPPPPPMHPGMLPGLDSPDGIMAVPDVKKSKKSKSSSKEPSSFQAWIAGGQVRKKR